MLHFPENGFQDAGPFLSGFLCAYCLKKLPERAPTKKRLCVLSIIDQLRVWAHRQSVYAQLSPLYPFLYPYVTHVINYSRPSPAFCTGSDGKLGGAWERGYIKPSSYRKRASYQYFILT